MKLIVSALVVAMVGCGSKPATDIKSRTSEPSKVTGSITVSGSSALLPLMEKTIEKFNAKYRDVEGGAQAGGAGTGLTQVLDGTVNIGNSHVFAQKKLDKSKATELVDHKVLAQGFCVVVSKSLGIDNLTKELISINYNYSSQIIS